MSFKAEIAIIGAMAEEVQALTQYTTQLETHQYMQWPYYLGLLHGKKVVVFQSGIGKVNAALATAFIIEHFAPQAIINIGSAGGVSDGLHIGDVIISSEVFYHDIDLTLLNCAYGQLPQMPKAFPADAQLMALAHQCVKVETDFRVLYGSIGSGDQFMSEPDDIAKLHQHFPDITAADMEAAAIAHTSYLYKVPFVIIRAISDVIDSSENKVDFFTFLSQAAENSAKAVKAMVSKL